jgi:hypothetical protein
MLQPHPLLIGIEFKGALRLPLREPLRGTFIPEICAVRASVEALKLARDCATVTLQKGHAIPTSWTTPYISPNCHAGSIARIAGFSVSLIGSLPSPPTVMLEASAVCASNPHEASFEGTEL